MKRTLVTFLIIILCLLALPAASRSLRAVANASITRQPQCGSWSIVPTPPKTQAQFKGVAMISSKDAWAVGFLGTSNQPTGTLTEHWDGTNWSIVPSLNPHPGIDYQLNAVTAVATNDIWAVGEYQNHGLKTLFEHWNGKRWRVFSGPIPPGQPILTSVAAISKNDVWAVGHDPTALIEHWNGRQWSIVPSPIITGGVGMLFSVNGVSSTDVWAVGVYITDPGYNKLTLLFHWNGKKWSRLNSQVDFDSSLGAVAAISTTNAWTVGVFDLRTLSEHWDGQSWRLISSPGEGSFNALTRVPGSHLLWAGGTDHLNGNGHTLAELWNGSAWSIVPTPNPGGISSDLLGVAASDASHVWAVGFYTTSSNETYPLAEFYC